MEIKPLQGEMQMENRKRNVQMVQLQKIGVNVNQPVSENPYSWMNATVADIQKKCYNLEEKQLVFEDTPKEIIGADTWERGARTPQEQTPSDKDRKTNPFSGIVRCTDCGEVLYYCTSKNFEARKGHFVCSTSRLKGKEVCPTYLRGCFGAGRISPYTACHCQCNYPLGTL